MLSIFPSLFAYEQLAPTLIRITLAIILLHWLYVGMKSANATKGDKVVSALEGLAGILILAGYMTQLGALIVVIDMIVRIVQKIGKKQFLTNGVNYYLVVLVLALTLMVTGAGLCAVDWPL